MRIKVTVSLVMPEYWGADEFLSDGGIQEGGEINAIKLMIAEDCHAFVFDPQTKWKVEKIRNKKRKGK